MTITTTRAFAAAAAAAAALMLVALPGAQALALGGMSSLPGVGSRALASRARPAVACGAGFGSGGAQAAKKGPKRAPLKPKRQWDRYADMTKKGDAPTFEVAARKDADSPWLSVGRVAVDGGEANAAAAAARQRALIAEHGKRLHLALKAVGKAPVQVGVRRVDGADFVLAGKAEDTLSDDVELGFEGVADAASGYYCHYQNGRVVASASASAGDDVEQPTASAPPEATS